METTETTFDPNSATFSEAVRGEIEFRRVERVEQSGVDKAWVKGIRVGMVVFPQEDGLFSLGLEVKIPMQFDVIKDVAKSEALKLSEKQAISLEGRNLEKDLERKGKGGWFIDHEFPLPESIKWITYLDLSFQENTLPRKLRDADIKSPRGWYHDLILANRIDRLLDNKHGFIGSGFGLYNTSLKRGNALTGVFKDVFGSNSDEAQKFIERLNISEGNEILIVHGHSGFTDVVSEKGYSGSGDKMRAVNGVDIKQVIERYNDPGKYAAILVHSCYLLDKPPPVKDIPVYRGRGYSDHPHWFGNKNYPLVSLPEGVER